MVSRIEVLDSFTSKELRDLAAKREELEREGDRRTGKITVTFRPLIFDDVEQVFYDTVWDILSLSNDGNNRLLIESEESLLDKFGSVLVERIRQDIPQIEKGSLVSHYRGSDYVGVGANGDDYVFPTYELDESLFEMDDNDGRLF